MGLKYHQFLIPLPDCPPSDYNEKERTEIYRFVYNEITDERNFQPPLIKNPSRIKTSPKYHNVDKRCGGYALSMFSTLSKIRKFYSDMEKRFPGIGDDLGRNIAKGNLKQEDGVCSKKNGRGKYNLHEYEDVNWNGRFEIIEPVGGEAS